MTTRPPRFSIIGLAAFAGVVTIVSTGLVVARSEPPPVRPAAVPAMPVDARAIRLQSSYTRHQAFTGHVEAGRVSTLGFDAAGRLDRVLVDEGDRVEAGALLAELDTARLQAHRAELIAAQSEAEARLALATATLKRLAGIVEQGGVSRQELDEAREAQRMAQAALRLAAQRIISVDVDLQKTRLLAPFAGTITGRMGDEGRVLASGEPIVELQEDDTPQIRIGIAGRALETLRVGQEYSLEWRGQVVIARLRSLLPVRSMGARTVDALFDPINLAATAGDAHYAQRVEGLLPGDTVTLHLDMTLPDVGAWVPMTALASGERGLWSLYVVRQDGGDDDNAILRIERRTVDVLHQTAERVYVRGNLQANDIVVQRGLQRIVPGQRVVIARQRMEARS